ncbi:hypothetical protein LX32DRAFT_62436 [Colletotrichum zoysiae]|uniref:Uncharacterized protein n=1 Tax=Colletotrichum zoysiae TaxID=1216348 RepID=A0AAD9HAD8_9PEZI|nr:hypothetical protein LX32DRAFT_62436 [Colletotrichum zoysiae]
MPTSAPPSQATQTGQTRTPRLPPVLRIETRTPCADRKPTCIRGGATCQTARHNAALGGLPPSPEPVAPPSKRRRRGAVQVGGPQRCLFFFSSHSCLIRDSGADIGSADIRKCRRLLHPAPGVSCHVTASRVLSAAGFEVSRPRPPFPSPE